MKTFGEFFNESATEVGKNKMRTKHGFEHPIPLVKKAQEFSELLDMSDSRMVAGEILDWCAINKVKLADVISKAKEDEVVLKLARKVFMGKDMSKDTPASKELKTLLTATTEV